MLLSLSNLLSSPALFCTWSRFVLDFVPLESQSSTNMGSSRYMHPRRTSTQSSASLVSLNRYTVLQGFGKHKQMPFYMSIYIYIYLVFILYIYICMYRTSKGALVIMGSEHL